MDAVRGDLGGPQLARTWPEISRHMIGAFRFDAAYAAGTRTTESVYSMLTGLWPHELTFEPTVADEADNFRVLPDDDPRVLDPASWKQHHPLPVADEHRSLAGMLGDAGYRTGAAAVSLFMLPGAGMTKDFGVVDIEAYRGVRSGAIRSESFSAPALTDRLIAFIDAEPAGDRPWFAWAHYLDTHIPYDADPTRPHEAKLPAPKRYLAEIVRTDAQIGRLLQHVVDTGQWDRTVVIVTSDHGEEFRDHGGLLHGTTVYEELLWVPLLLRVPGLIGRWCPSASASST